MRRSYLVQNPDTTKELSLCHKLGFLNPISSQPIVVDFIYFRNSVRSKNLSLKYKMFTL